MDAQRIANQYLAAQHRPEERAPRRAKYWLAMRWASICERFCARTAWLREVLRLLPLIC
jgi:hypothetical protein